ncbi:MAG TPA: pyrroloquinoline quinone biosynthesis protein PqqB [Thiobacillus sp.]|uniref:pyrroloquinoline quinone biosynthesis protein PqqB n=1 Tax=Acidovorax sp. TaxID=1872122 RepID=UPI0026395626|nr:pyrroloquinoline quinone biosynthesis protein PqqB [Acidovorax sp.]HQT19177.1 pyrroloquinoline quinone biosynthesis protein PqqB [Acidovorax defluvii]HQT71533.1 pyrroloquinoline quinone biosynthesis protein PqqB [Thiobacillus sp.]
MKILVLGAAAGGGYPQWNCNCRQCGGLRRGTTRAFSRTQSSIAVSQDGLDWVLLNASPDLGQQIRDNAVLHPRAEPRDTPIRAIVLMDAQLDHVTGLLSLREGPPVELYCTPGVLEDLTVGLPILPTLRHYCGVHWNEVSVVGNNTSAEFTVPALPRLRFTAVAVAGRAPPYSARRDAPAVGDNIALIIDDIGTGERLFYAPGLAHVDQAAQEALAGATCVMVDGTFWTEDEMLTAGLSRKMAAEMGHLPQSGPNGMLVMLTALAARRKILIHINNSNPILDHDSAEHLELQRHGIEVAHDGMEIDL